MALTTSYAMGPALEAKIAGGDLALRGEFPHHVGLVDAGHMGCGGTIISALLILTAAHCLEHKTARDLQILAGEYDRKEVTGAEQMRNVRGVYQHENFTRIGNSLRNDVGLILLDEPLEYSKWVQNISLPRRGEEFTGTVTLIGWGYEELQRVTGSARLRKVVVPIVSHEECTRNYTRGSPTREVTRQMMCAGMPGKDTCKGDSGGPAVCYRNSREQYSDRGEYDARNAVICGVVSWGEGCGEPGFPGVNTKVSRYVDWIQMAAKKISLRMKCRSDQFHCASGCVPRSSLCDSVQDCADGADEVGCVAERVVCKRTEFRCSDGRCIRNRYVCDGDNDCRDGSDELKCPLRKKPCSTTEYRCGASGRCIPAAWKCDRQIDCDDNSDELGCPRSGVVIPVLKPVSTPPPPSHNYSKRQKCGTEEFWCSSGCIPRSAICNGYADCSDGTDERNCVNVGPCDYNGFRCDNGWCIQRVWVCDGDDDCGNRAEEQKCPPKNRTCAKGEFRCGAKGRCIPRAWRCDRFRDCDDNSDEMRCHFGGSGGKGMVADSREPKHTVLEEVTPSLMLPTSPCASGEAPCGTTRLLLSNSTTPETTTTGPACNADQFPCKNDLLLGDCIPLAFQCDGEVDCIKGEDEEGCQPPKEVGVTFQEGITSTPDYVNSTLTPETSPVSLPTTTPSSTSSEHSSPLNVTTTESIPPEGRICSLDQFRCNVGTYPEVCIPVTWRCDQKWDCPFGEDEAECEGLTETESPGTPSTSSTTEESTTSPTGVSRRWRTTSAGTPGNRTWGSSPIPRRFPRRRIRPEIREEVTTGSGPWGFILLSRQPQETGNVTS